MKVGVYYRNSPAGLMAAEVLSHFQVKVIILEARNSPGWKILVAGSSGLNVTFDSPLPEYPQFLRQKCRAYEKCLELFPPKNWLNYLNELGMEPF